MCSSFVCKMFRIGPFIGYGTAGGPDPVVRRYRRLIPLSMQRHLSLSMFRAWRSHQYRGTHFWTSPNGRVAFRLYESPRFWVMTVNGRTVHNVDY